jgi:hypothetical protein
MLIKKIKMTLYKFIIIKYQMNSIIDIENILIDLDMFSRLPSNTFVHLNRYGHFIITAQTGAYIYGLQTITNMWKEHTTEKLITDFHGFSHNIINILNNELNLIKQELEQTIKYEHIKIIVIICREFKLAYYGLPNTLNSGMRGLLKTFNTDPLFLKLYDEINFIKDYIDKIKNIINTLEIDDNYCPEINFTDEDWENVIQIVPSLKKECVGICKYYINYSSVVTLNQLKFNGNLWDEIIKFDKSSLILGELPIYKGIYGYFERNDIDTLVKLGVKAVLSVTEIFENNTEGYIYSPIMPSDWKKANVKHYQIPSSDYCTMHLEQIQKAVEFIHWNIKNNRTIYVHCKSGKSRSFLVVLCYLIKYLGYNCFDAINHVKSKRIQAGFGKNSTKMIVLKKFENYVKNLHD